MKNCTLSALICFLLLAPSLFAQTTVTTVAPIPEEARKHFVIGTTLFKDAKTADDFSQVESEFKQAADLAPQWPEARYNLALAKESAGDYSGAMADLKLYKQFKLSDADARTVQDKIYALEAKAGLAAKKQAEVARIAAEQAAAQQKRKEEESWPLAKFKGTWKVNYAGMNDAFFSISNISATGGTAVMQGHDEEIISVKNNQLEMRQNSGNIINYTTIVLTGDNSAHYYFYQTVGGRRSKMMDNNGDLIRTSN